MKFIKYKDRFKKHACPLCGCTEIEHFLGHATYPEVWNLDKCAYCGCVVGFEDNSPWYDIWDKIKKARVRSKKKVLEIVRWFYDGSNQDRNYVDCRNY